MGKAFTFLSAGMVLAATCPPAVASTLKYSLSGPDNIVFYVNQAPTPDEVNDFTYAQNFRLFGVKGTLDLEDGRTVNVNYNLSFYGDVNNGGIDISTVDYDPVYGWEENYYIVASTDLLPTTSRLQLFDGPVSSPSLVTGRYDLIDSFAIFGPAQSYVLSITAVPEPATWAMMVAGFGLVAGAMRRHRTRVCMAAA